MLFDATSRHIIIIIITNSIIIIMISIVVIIVIAIVIDTVKYRLQGADPGVVASLPDFAEQLSSYIYIYIYIYI